MTSRAPAASKTRQPDRAAGSLAMLVLTELIQGGEAGFHHLRVLGAGAATCPHAADNLAANDDRYPSGNRVGVAEIKQIQIALSNKITEDFGWAAELRGGNRFTSACRVPCPARRDLSPPLDGAAFFSSQSLN